MSKLFISFIVLLATVSANNASLSSGLAMVYPNGLTEKPNVTSEFGPRVDPITKKPGAPHDGVDCTGFSEIKAIADGTVKNADFHESAGYRVYIDHGNGLVSKSMHMQKNSIVVEKGKTVKMGDKLGIMGSTGRSTGTHLHLQLELNGKPIEPFSYIKERLNSEQKPEEPKAEESKPEEPKAEEPKAEEEPKPEGTNINATTESATGKNTTVTNKHKDIFNGLKSPKGRKRLPQQYFTRTLAFEGGYSKHRQGETNRGITAAALAEAKKQGLVSRNVTIQSLTKDIGSVRKIYEKNYYIAGKASMLPHPLAYAHFDACVNHGVSSCIKLLQKTLNSHGAKVKEDGKLHMATSMVLPSVLKKNSPKKLAKTYCDHREKKYNMMMKAFQKGWINRLAKVRKFCGI